jgi:hypothetical protein
MPRVGLEPTNAVFHRVKTFNALDRAATLIGLQIPQLPIFKSSEFLNPCYTTIPVDEAH